MRMSEDKMKLISFSILLLSTLIVYAQNSVEGIWCSDPNPNRNNIIERDLSWGKKDVPRQFDIIIDLHSEIPKIEISNFTTDDIINVIEQVDITKLTFYFRRGNFNVTMICHFNEDGTMWIEPLPDGLTFFGTGQDFIYYKIEDPSTS